MVEQINIRFKFSIQHFFLLTLLQPHAFVQPTPQTEREFFLSFSLWSQNVTSTFVVSPNILKKIYEFWDMGKIELESSIPDLRCIIHNITTKIFKLTFPTFSKQHKWYCGFKNQFHKKEKLLEGGCL